MNTSIQGKEQKPKTIGCKTSPGPGLSLDRGFRFPCADTGRFTALDPLRDKGGDKDWYGYCVDDPVNRVDVWGLESNGNKPYFCNWAKCDENGILQGDYKPIDIHPGAEPFLLDNSLPLPDILAGPFRGDDNSSKEIRVPLGFDFVDPFRAYYERNK